MVFIVITMEFLDNVDYAGGFKFTSENNDC